jgi:hypothetical protein
MTDALLDNSGSFYDWLTYFASIFCLCDLKLGFVDR